ncbi:MAG TPA: sugar kinase [Acidisoma sp.]|nr:sugar kinase [Acidisoma sp.]
MAAELLCIGEPMLEFNQQPALPDGPVLYQQGFGGDTSNVAVSAARQGISVGYISAVGRDPAGEALLDLWKAEGVDASNVKRSDTHPTGIYFVSHGTDGHRFSYHRRGSAASALTPADIPETAIAEARILFASGISHGISNTAADSVFHAFAIARKHGVAIAYDTNYRPALWAPRRAAAIIHAAVGEADIAMPGLDDALALTGLTDPDAVVDFYLSLGPGLVLLKMGSEGVYLATPEGRTRIAPFPAAAVDATGAGDTFCGAVIARLLKGDAPEDAAHYAAAAAAISTTGYGAIAPIPRAPEVWAAMAMRNR